MNSFQQPDHDDGKLQLVLQLVFWKDRVLETLSVLIVKSKEGKVPAQLVLLERATLHLFIWGRKQIQFLKHDFLEY